MVNVRSIVGLAIGATVTFAAARIHRRAKDEGRSISELIPELPSILHRDVERFSDAARGAVKDGKQAASDRRQEIEEVLSRPRQTKKEQ